ncbi:DUF4335 domain-containing protein [Microseira wollei]|uniref:DUF4335 domain-containing protein n=1 Tax=Microseira wollei NIES-4236 TaxID=2530354 RepID=A0AAV3XLU5_9CYAN|nr:DUF4335 domain-containing protein [Microseira wollei]GET43613.1 hypothetical protein MiSe_84380 [Microseira wollei NIES-4236]
MTIQRQYSLPNCTLFLEGLSDATTGNRQLEMRPVMSILVNAECHLAGGKPTISGGREFFESLVKAVSRYAQAFLSGVPHPDEDGQALPLVKIQQIDRHLHRLILQDPEHVAVSNGATGNSKAMTSYQIDLTTVQLFDLVEAVDQFFADTQTLPDVSVPLVPVSRRYAKPDEPIAKKAAPAALGVSSLALAAIAFFLVPVPEVQKPQDPRPRSDANSLSTTPNPTEPATTGEPPLTPTPTTGALLSPSPTPLETPLATPLASPSPTETPLVSPSPTDSPTTGGLISPTPTATPGTTLVSPTPTETPGTSPVSPTPTDLSTTGGLLSPTPTATPGTTLISPTPGETPGATLVSPTPETPGATLVSPTPGETPGATLVSPTPGETPGATLVSPTPGETPGATLASPTPTNSPLVSQGAEINDARTLRQLNTTLYNSIQQKVEGRLRFPDKLEYRVGVRADGTVVEYEARNQAAIDYADQTPLPKLQSSTTPVAPATGTSEPIAYYRVVFTRRGVLQVSPWRGIP